MHPYRQYLNTLRAALGRRLTVDDLDYARLGYSDGLTIATLIIKVHTIEINVARLRLQRAMREGAKRCSI